MAQEDWIRSREPWLQFHEAVAVVRQYLGCSIGKAEALIKASVASDEVRTVDAAIQDFTRRPGSGVKKIKRHSMDDLLYWLKPQIPQDKPKPTRRKRVQHSQDEARRAISALWPRGIPSPAELPNKRLCHQVCEWLEADYSKRKLKLAKPSFDSVLRAAKRKKRKGN
jgi:hypothetical protein